MSGSDQVSILSKEDGIVENLIPYMTAESGVVLDDFVPGFLAGYLSDDKTQLDALPFGCSTPVLYTNKTLLDKAGLEVPTTWDELYAVCQALVDGGYCSYGFAQPRDSWYFWMMIPNWGGVEVFTEDGMELGCQDVALEAYEFLQDMIRNNYFYPGPATDGGTICKQMLANQECAFYINSIGSLGGIQSSADEAGWELSVEGVPGGTVASVPSGGNSMVMMASSEHKAEAWTFLQWLYTSEDGLAWFDSQSGYLACTETIKNSSVIQEKMASSENYARAYEFLANVNNNHRIVGEGDVSNSVMAFMDAVFYDLEDVSTQLDTLSSEIKEIMSDIKG
jgi:ABC-type glycerol-3-phosphate transport system substrate-binding protein